MSLRKVTSDTDTSHTPTRGFAIYRDAEWDEWRVKFYLDGKHQTEGDYHTPDKQDAYLTANSFLLRGF